MNLHSRLSPSSANIWAAPDGCPGSVRMQEQHPEIEDSEDHIDGDVAHEIGGITLEDPLRFVKDVADGVTGTNEEIVDAVNTYVNTVRSVTGERKVQVEQSVSVLYVHPECWGTPDSWWYDSANDTLHVWDLKYGWGIVEVFRNFQLLLYALGIIAEVNASKTHLHIVQPRPYHHDGPVRTWELTRDEALSFTPQLHEAAEEALSDDPRLRTGGHCRYCTALHACPAAQKAQFNAMEMAAKASSPQVPPEQLGYELTLLRRAADIINHRLKAIESTALALDKRGVNIPGWTRDFSAGRTQWDSLRETEIRTVAEMYGVTVDKPAALITPAQAVKAGIPKEIVDQYSIKQTGKAKLVPVNFDKLQLVFGGEANE